MFHSLSFELQFASTGRVFARDIEFRAGLNAIIGPNESGKSLILEMMRVAIFGTGALRGAASDFESFKLEAIFSVKGERLKVYRDQKGAKLSSGNVVLATGTTAVNGKLIDIFGFGLPVFDVACAVNQGDVERLSTMTPTERRRMVDSVVGISALEKLAQWAGSEALLVTKRAEGMSAALRKPVEPVEPEGYQAGWDWQAAVTKAVEEERNYVEADVFLSVTHEPPTLPVCEVSEPAAELLPKAQAQDRMQSDIARLRAELVGLKEIRVVPANELDRLEREVKAWNEYQKAQTWLRNNAPPPIPLADCLDALKLIEQHLKAETHEREVETLKRQISEAEKHALTCPSCEHEFFLDQNRVENLRKRLGELHQSKPPHPPTKPLHSSQQLARWVTDWSRYDLKAAEAATLVRAVPDPKVTEADLRILWANHDLLQRRETLTTQLNNLLAQTSDIDWGLRYRKRLAYEQALTDYTKSLEKYKAWLVQRDEMKDRLVQLGDAPKRAHETRAKAEQARFFEHNQKVFLEMLGNYTKGCDEVIALTNEAAQFRATQVVFKDLRVKVKQYLLPSLNAVASTILRGMTGGQRNKIVVDDNFDIAVDDQPIRTLSGSGKACANLALRIALGQVLTNKTFSVLLADEIDAAMDEFRAEQTALTLRTMADCVSQIILVSHKSVDADYYIDLGDGDVQASGLEDDYGDSAAA